ncbi:MAG TPA: hypothetical protein VGO37_08450 [Steroidobacteraceae bacterium]|nr:hypothetical protein [Steroidobacteraceae bacterium]
MTAAQDAFGTSIGFQNVGLYSANDPWAASLQWNLLSTRVATTDNTRDLPSLATLGAGVRYHWMQMAHPWTVRLDASNLADSRGLHVSDLDVVLPEQGRRFALTWATDF